MNKDWEEEFNEKFVKKWSRLIKEINIPLSVRDAPAWTKIQDHLHELDEIKAFIDKHLSRAVAKERTQFLARVREEVIKEIDFPLLLLETTTKLPAMAVDVKGILEQLKQEQLKKLEIISEESK